MVPHIFTYIAVIITIISIVLFVSIIIFVTTQREGFLNPIPSNSATTKTEQGDLTNANWRQILTYLQQNPQNSGAFLEYLQKTFFEGTTCSVKVIDFSHLADTYTPLFT